MRARILLTTLAASAIGLDAHAGSRIIGGEAAAPGAWPWVVGIVETAGIQPGPDYSDAHQCGGSLIDARWVLTAAHCVTDDYGNKVQATTMTVVAGLTNLAKPETSYQARAATRIIVHEQYDTWDIVNDLALIELASPFLLGDRVQVVPIAGPDAGSLAGQDAWFAGWGAVNDEDEDDLVFLPTLAEVELPILSNDECDVWFQSSQGGGSGWVTDAQLCAGYEAGGKDPCMGDSGGGLVIPSPWRVAGVLSWGFGCADPMSPGVYTRASAYKDWICGQVGDGLSCTDGDPCNGDEVCAAGACVASAVPVCDDGDPCTIDGCDPTSGCTHAGDPSCAVAETTEGEAAPDAADDGDSGDAGDGAEGAVAWAVLDVADDFATEDAVDAVTVDVAGDGAVDAGRGSGSSCTARGSPSGSWPVLIGMIALSLLVVRRVRGRVG